MNGVEQKGFSAWIALALVVVLFLAAGGGAYWYFFGTQQTPQTQIPSSSPTTTGAIQKTSPATTAPQAPLYLKTESFTASSSVSEYKPGEKATVTASSEKLPQAAQFKTFAYDQTIGKTISVSGSCTDVYFAIVMFRAADDYKKNPAAAVFNQAFPCPANHAFSQSIDVKNSNVPSGQYYFFVADQGNTGTWYNPR